MLVFISFLTAICFNNLQKMVNLALIENQLFNTLITSLWQQLD